MHDIIMLQGNAWRQIAQWMKGPRGPKNSKPKKGIFSTRTASKKYFHDDKSLPTAAPNTALDRSYPKIARQSVSGQQAGLPWIITACNKVISSDVSTSPKLHSPLAYQGAPCFSTHFFSSSSKISKSNLFQPIDFDTLHLVHRFQLIDC